jgi:molecular chaperone DnaK (HSP70)
MTWAIDLGTTNTGVCRWDDVAQRPRLLDLPEICRLPEGENHLEAPRLIPSTTHVLSDPGWSARFSSMPWMAKRFSWGRLAHIGRPAEELNKGMATPQFVPSFKGWLGHDPFRIMARAGRRNYNVREVAQIYVRELLAEVKRSTGERIKELVVTTPVESYERYRAEVARLFRQVGVKKLRFVDEPVAAAVGYGLGAKRNRLVLVVDFGGGTLDLALVQISAKGIQDGHCEVLAKEGRAVGGNLVDRWLAEEFCERLDFPLHEHVKDEGDRFWYQMLLGEARRVKEAVFFEEEVHFNLQPPEELREFQARLRGESPELPITQKLLVDIMTQRGLFDTLQSCFDGIQARVQALGLTLDAVEDVLMVGGSTLLPQVYHFFEERFSRGRVRAWQPFEAVAFGACSFAANQFHHSDFIVHDYAFVTHNAKTHQEEYSVIIPRGTRVPTAPDFWKRQLVPTCSLGEPETIFKLLISEIGRNDEGARRFNWDAMGGLHKLGGTKGASEELIVALNDANPTLGTLRPPHLPSDRKPRLEIAFGVNDERWLEATVRDLKTKKMLMESEPVVRLL